tara:strand:+ start:1738 stop:1998 length:261 start_codon:yes stop_codon:yes gene_type:complete
MSDKTYRELENELSELQDALDGETNPDTRLDIERHIDEVNTLISDYDISDDDLFECTNCSRIADIDDSHKTEDGLICDICHYHKAQ